VPATPEPEVPPATEPGEPTSSASEPIAPVPTTDSYVTEPEQKPGELPPENIPGA
jgi:hypothetical protein